MVFVDVDMDNDNDLDKGFMEVRTRTRTRKRTTRLLTHSAAGERGEQGQTPSVGEYFAALDAAV